jgi:hypothetical protein
MDEELKEKMEKFFNGEYEDVVSKYIPEEERKEIIKLCKENSTKSGLFKKFSVITKEIKE